MITNINEVKSSTDVNMLSEEILGKIMEIAISDVTDIINEQRQKDGLANIEMTWNDVFSWLEIELPEAYNWFNRKKKYSVSL
tara:strand:+ start:279 stop:524 length:246 start_codon:yes stop_codon:yes gene_type:complete